MLNSLSCFCGYLRTSSGNRRFQLDSSWMLSAEQSTFITDWEWSLRKLIGSMIKHISKKLAWFELNVLVWTFKWCTFRLNYQPEIQLDSRWITFIRTPLNWFTPTKCNSTLFELNYVYSNVNVSAPVHSIGVQFTSHSRWITFCCTNNAIADGHFNEMHFTSIRAELRVLATSMRLQWATFWN